MPEEPEQAQESQAEENDERRRRIAAKRLIDRFREPEGFDYAALREASAQWQRE